MSTATLPFKIIDRPEGIDRDELRDDLPGILPEDFQKAVQEYPHLLEYLKILPLEKIGIPEFCSELTRKLADHNIDVKYAYGTIQQGVGKATIILAVSDFAAAAKVMK